MVSGSRSKKEGGLRVRGKFSKKGTGKKPLVSVVTICLNCKEYLEKTLKSVIGQDYRNVEYVIIDGGSTDGTLEVLKKYDKHIAYWVSEPDKGIYDAYNKGVRNSSGDWITIIGASDYYSGKQAISRVMKSSAGADILYGDCRVRYEPGFSRVQGSCDIDDLWKGMCISTPTIFFRKKVLARFRFDTKYRLAADFDIMMRCIKAGFRFRHAKFPVVVCSAGGFADSNQVKNTMEFWRIAREHHKGIMTDIYYTFYFLKSSVLALVKSILPRRLYVFLIRFFWS